MYNLISRAKELLPLMEVEHRAEVQLIIDYLASGAGDWQDRKDLELIVEAYERYRQPEVVKVRTHKQLNYGI